MMLKVELERDAAQALLASLERRLEVIHDVEKASSREIAEFVTHERDTLVLAIIALEAALKRPLCQ
jgi:hypothetical protein